MDQMCESKPGHSPVRLVGASPLAIARFPRLAPGGSGAFVIGVPFQLADDSPLRESPLAVWDPQGREVGYPAGHFTFLYPRGFVDAKKRLHVLWGEPSPDVRITTAPKWVFGRSASIWTATYDSDIGWSTAKQIPVTIAGIDGLRWDRRGTGDNLGRATASGIGVEELRRPKDMPLQYLAFDRQGNPTTIGIPVPWDAKSIDVTRAVDRWLVTYTFTDRSKPPPREGASVFAIVSNDGGHSWSLPVAVPGSVGAMDLVAISNGGQRVHLLWKQPTQDGFRIRHAVSGDGGDSWSNTIDLDPEGRPENLRAAVDGCGSVHFTFEDWTHEPDGVHVVYSIFDGRWSPLDHLLPKRKTMTADLATLPDGNVAFVYVARTGESLSEPFATYYSVVGARR